MFTQSEKISEIRHILTEFLILKQIIIDAQFLDLNHDIYKIIKIIWKQDIIVSVYTVLQNYLHTSPSKNNLMCIFQLFIIVSIVNFNYSAYFIWLISIIIPSVLILWKQSKEVMSKLLQFCLLTKVNLSKLAQHNPNLAFFLFFTFILFQVTNGLCMSLILQYHGH